MNIKIKEYKGYNIEYSDTFDMFQALKDGEICLESSKVRDLETKIDAAIKRQAKSAHVFPIEAVWSEYGVPHLGKITSVAENGEIWFSYTEGGGKAKCTKVAYYSLDDLYPVNAETSAWVTQYAEITNQIKVLGEKRGGLRPKSLVPIDINAIVNGI